MSVNPNGQVRILKSAKAIGERTLVELTSSCSNLSHYQAQQQLWAAIRARGGLHDFYSILIALVNISLIKMC